MEENVGTQKKSGAGTRILKWAGIVLGSILALAVVAGVAGAIYETTSESRDLGAYPPEGAIYQVEGARLHLVAYGEERPGVPTVVIEAGMGDWSAAWKPVALKLARETRVVLYDRAGLGYSSPDSHPRDAERIARQLHELLAKAGIDGPIVLAGHSIGGAYVREYYGLFPEDVAGIVLIDSCHPEQESRLPADINDFERKAMGSLSSTATLGQFGVLRLAGPAALGVAAPAGLDKRDAEAFAAMSIRPACINASAAEYKALGASLAEAGAVRSFGDLPLMVLSNGLGNVDPSQLPPSIPASSAAAMNAGWKAMQDELAALSTRSQHRVAAQSHHNIQLEEPDAAVDAIGALLAGLSPQASPAK